jgi:hypothetical protein
MKNLIIGTVILLCMALASCSLSAQWAKTNMQYGNTRVNALAANSSYLFCGTTSSGVYRSSDNGAHWTQLLSGLSSYNIYSLFVSGSDIFAGTDAGVCISTDNGSTWTPAGLSTRTVYSFAAQGGYLFAGTDNCVYTSTDNGSTWTPHYSSYTYDAALAFIGGSLFAGSQFNGVCVSTDNGSNWTGVNAGLTYQNVFALAVMPTGPSSANFFAGTLNGGVFLSADSGAHWTAVDSGLTNKNVLALAVSGTNIVCGIAGFNSNNNVFLSTNSGTSWSSVSSGFTGINNVYSFLIVGDTLYAGTNDGVWARPLSETGLPIRLSHFTGAMAGAEVVKFEWSTVTEVNNYGFYVERQEGIHPYATVSGLIPGAGTTLEEQQYTWSDSPVGPGIYFYRLKQVDLSGDISYSPPIRVVVTAVTGVKMGTLPGSFALGQNYPSPFNPATNIQYALPGASNVTLGVYNTLGQLVALLVDGVQDGGYMTAAWNAANIPSGVYFYRLDATSISDPAKHFSQTRKMVLIR